MIIGDANVRTTKILNTHKGRIKMMKGETRPRACMVQYETSAWIKVARPFSTLNAGERSRVLSTYTRSVIADPYSDHTDCIRSYIVQDDTIHTGRAVDRMRQHLRAVRETAQVNALASA